MAETNKTIADKPLRNCDAGSAEQQFERWLEFCARYDIDCTGCPCDDGHTCTLAYCFAKWAQMPYEKGESDGSKYNNVKAMREALADSQRPLLEKLALTGEREKAARGQIAENNAALAAAAGKSPAAGDATKLRKALEALVDDIEMRAPMFGVFRSMIEKTFLDAKAALAAPPRNCDRFATRSAANNYWAQSCPYYPETGILMPFDEWLFAPWTEKERENR